MIVRHGWKLAAIRQEDGLTPTLMTHLDEDPYEQRNRVGDPTVAGRRSDLHARLAAWDESTYSS